MTEVRNTRRDLLKASGALGLGVSLTGCDGEDHFAPHKPPVPGSAGWMRGEERFVATSCAQCEAGCGVLVRVVEGRAVKVEGNPDCPVNRGGLGPRGLSAPQVLYDPDRIRGPLLAAGSRGSGQWEEISWEQALGKLIERLVGLREDARPEQLGILCGRERGMVRELWQRFARVFGTPNLFDGGRSDDGAQIAAVRAMQGVAEVPAYDWENTRLVLSLGSGVLTSSCQNLHFARMRGRSGAGLGRARILHVGPALSRTAMNADEWISSRPGTHAAFALGLAHVLVREELHDGEFIEQRTQGFEPWTDGAGRQHLGLRELLEEYTPAHVATICDVPEQRIEELARVMAESRPCFAIAGSDDLKAAGGVQTAMAVHALNALLGSIDRPGGLLIQQDSPLADWEDMETDEIADEGLGRRPLWRAGARAVPSLGWTLDQLPSALTEASPYALDTLLIDHSNPVYARAQAPRWREALATIPFTVSFSPFMDETTSECADLVLPDDSWLERWEDAGAAPSLGRAVFGLRQPVVERLYDTRSTSDVVIELAKGVGEGVEEAFPWKDFRSALKARIIGLYQAKRGSIVESKGSTFLKRLYAEGYWAGDDYEYEQWSRVLRTESGRFEFFSSSLWQALIDEAGRRSQTPEEFALALAGVEDPDRLCLPDQRQTASAGEAARYPLLLLPYKPHTYARGSGANLPWLAELAAWRGRSTWTSEAQLHPKTAGENGIGQGDRVTLESAAGSVEARAYLCEGVRPRCVRLALGAGHSAFGRYAQGWGANGMRLVSDQTPDPLGGSSLLQGTRVAIKKSEV